ncbi:MAG: tetratricopeptide repeat protein [Candidatus Gastranaerophilaceae bacterium]|jgi:tetratricopeptide (TPR) repeat protein
MLKLIKKASFKILLSISLIFILIFAFLLRAQIKEQYHHVIAFYKVYKGDNEYKKGQFSKAIDYYNQALLLYPGHIKARYNLGNIYVAYEDYGSALACYEEALRYKENFLNARINLGILLTEQFFDYQRAIKEYEKVIKYAPIIINIPFIYNNESFVKNAKAIAYYNTGLAYKGQSLMLGDKNNFSKYYLEQAAESYKNALKIQPDNYDDYFNLALTFQLLGYKEKATSAYCKAINLAPWKYDAHYNFAILLRDRKNYVDSIIELEKAGLIIDTKGEGFSSYYIYEVLSEVTKSARAQGDYKSLMEKINNNPVNTFQLSYIDGKVVSTEDFDKAMVQNMKYCSACEDQDND